jgi:hypothetical protein
VTGQGDFNMCKKTNYQGTSNTQIDKCMREEIKDFNRSIKLLKPYIDTLKIVACCCGHGKYPKTIILKEEVDEDNEAMYFEHFTQIEIPRTRNFYKKDKKGYYYIPELNKKNKSYRMMSGVSIQ